MVNIQVRIVVFLMYFQLQLWWWERTDPHKHCILRSRYTGRERSRTKDSNTWSKFPRVAMPINFPTFRIKWNRIRCMKLNSSVPGLGYQRTNVKTRLRSYWSGQKGDGINSGGRGSQQNWTKTINSQSEERSHRSTKWTWHRNRSCGEVCKIPVCVSADRKSWAQRPKWEV